MKTNEHYSNSFPSASEPIEGTIPARQARVISDWRDMPSLFSGEYQQPSSNLPEQVSQAESAAYNESMSGNNVWPATSEASAPMLAGTKVTASGGR